VKNTRIYIAGKVTGDAGYMRKFARASTSLMDAGYRRVINPAVLIDPDTDWNTAMKKLLPIMLECDGVALLSDWRESRGARIEGRVAREVGIPVKPIGQWIAPVVGEEEEDEWIAEAMKEAEND
jgi:hypothetical protein